MPMEGKIRGETPRLLFPTSFTLKPARSQSSFRKPSPSRSSGSSTPQLSTSLPTPSLPTQASSAIDINIDLDTPIPSTSTSTTASTPRQDNLGASIIISDADDDEQAPRSYDVDAEGEVHATEGDTGLALREQLKKTLRERSDGGMCSVCALGRTGEADGCWARYTDHYLPRSESTAVSRFKTVRPISGYVVLYPSHSSQTHERRAVQLPFLDYLRDNISSSQMLESQSSCRASVYSALIQIKSLTTNVVSQKRDRTSSRRTRARRNDQRSWRDACPHIRLRG